MPHLTLIGRRGLQTLVRSPRAGSILLICVMGLVVLMGFTAMAIDVGAVHFQSVRMQSYCDAAALAAAAGLPDTTAAKDAGAAYYQVNVNGSTTQPVGNNGTYTIGDQTVVATTPFSDAYTTSKNWTAANLVRVSATCPFPLTFGRVLGINSVDVTRSAVALRCGAGQGEWGTGDGCLFALDQGFDLVCNGFKVAGSVISNNDIAIDLNTIWIGHTLHAKQACNLKGLQIRGGFKLEYGTTYRVTSNNADISAITKTPQVDITPPLNYNPANFRTDFDIDSTFTGNVNINGSTVITAPGTYYITGDLNINANNTHVNNSTFIVGGSVNINTNNLTLGYHEKYMTFYLLGGGTIHLTQNNLSVNGDLYAPNGYISTSSNNIHKGWWVARKISVNCNNFELDGLPGRDGGNSVALVE